MMHLKPTLAALLVAVALPQTAAATIVQTFADRASFTAAATHPAALPLALAGSPPVFVSDFTVGGLTITAQDGGLAGDGGTILSTEFDGDVLVLDFANPIFSIGLSGGVTNEAFGYIDGELLVDVIGSGSAALVANGGAGYLGLISDVGFIQLRLSITSFDTNASSIAFATIQDQVDTGGALPEPATWATLGIGFGALGLFQRSRRRVTRHAC